MTRNVRTYDHFCTLARALETVGERWTLLVVRDLLSGPKRFTDLMDRLGGITPKTLTQRLRDLDDAGIVEADRVPGRREVRYQLTASGEALAPVVDDLAWWGWQHAWRPPRADEPVHAEHLLLALCVVLDHETTTRQRSPLRWHFQFDDDGQYTLSCDGEHWSLTSTAPSGPADVTIVGTMASWWGYVRQPTTAAAERLGLKITGPAAAARRFKRLVGRLREHAMART